MKRTVGRFPNDIGLEGIIRDAVHLFLSQGDPDVYPITAEESEHLDEVIDLCCDGVRIALRLDEDGHRILE